VPPSTPASLPAIPANLNTPAPSIGEINAVEYGDIATDNGYLTGLYGSLAVRFNNLLLFTRCMVVEHNTGAKPAACPK
jgi:hypothetical protein